MTFNPRVNERNERRERVDNTVHEMNTSLLFTRGLWKRSEEKQKRKYVYFFGFRNVREIEYGSETLVER